MDAFIFHLETIPDEDLKEIAQSLNLTPSTSREALISDILSYYAHLEGFQEQPSRQPSNSRCSQRNTRSQANTRERHSRELLEASSRGISRLDHPSCAGTSRYLGSIDPEREAESAEADPRVSLRSVLRRWEEIGYLEEQSRGRGRRSRGSSETPRTSRGRSANRSTHSPPVSSISDDNSASPRNTDASPTTLLDFQFQLRPSEGHAPSSTEQSHTMNLRSRSAPSNQSDHPMALRQRRAPRESTQPESSPVARPARRSVRRSRSPPNTSLVDRGVEGIMDADVEYWLDIQDTIHDHANGPFDIEYLDVLSGSDEDEEEFEDVEIIDDGLDPQDIQECTVEGRFKSTKVIVEGQSGTKNDDPNTSNGDDKRECPICIESFNENDRIRTLPCFHIYHVECIDRWLQSNSKCPICKNSVVQNSV